MRRREVILLASGALLVPRALLAQPSRRIYRVAILDDAIESARAERWKLFRNRLQVLGLIEGKDVIYETRYARGANERLPALAAELVALKPDVIVTATTPSTSALMKATSSIPIVFTGAGDPVRTGLVASLARPGGNVTGISVNSPEIVGKQLELLRELAPAAIRLAYLAEVASKATVATFRQVEGHARTMKVTIQMLDAGTRSELERSFETIKRERVQGLIVGSTGPLIEHRDQIVQFAATEKLPAVYGQRENVVAGGLLSYSVDYRFGYLRGADYVHQILQGAKPADLPVEQTRSLQMALNLKTARALGIKIPDSVRLRADEVIE